MTRLLRAAAAVSMVFGLGAAAQAQEVTRKLVSAFAENGIYVQRLQPWIHRLEQQRSRNSQHNCYRRHNRQTLTKHGADRKLFAGRDEMDSATLSHASTPA